MQKQDLEVIQQKIGYRFHNLDLLRQAFVRRTYSEENGGENNEVLEFIGDKVLDFCVVKLLTETYGYMLEDCSDFDPQKNYKEFACDRNEDALTKTKTQLVQKRYLANRMEELEFAQYLITGSGDCSGETPSVMEDLFEAILGAAAIDCDWDLAKLEVLVDHMLSPDMMLNDNPISQIEAWMAKKRLGRPEWKEIRREPSYQIDLRTGQKTQIRQKNFYCKVHLSQEFPPFAGSGYSAREARMDACAHACAYLEQNGLLNTIREEIENPNFCDAISQLEILARRGYFSIPTYQFKEEHDSDGNPVWTCVCQTKEKEQTFSATSSSKKDAKKTAAFQMLTDVLR